MLSFSAGVRPILDGKEFDKFFPLSLLENSNVIIKREGSVEDAVKIMAQIAEKYKSDTALLSDYLKGDTIEKTCENIWSFIHTYIQYQEDQDGIEQIRRPIRSWSDRQEGVDCDCMSVFVSSILKNLDIDHYFRITKYDKPEYQHVYVIVPTNGHIAGIKDYYTIDGVISGFNKEKSFSDNKDFNTMSGIPIQFLNGIGSKAQDNGLTEIYNYLAEIKNRIEADPQAIKEKICPCDAVPMFDLLLKSWNDDKKRAWSLQKLAQIEAEHFPNLKFFQALNQYMLGNSTPETVMKENYLNGFSGLNGGWGVGDNGNGTFYVYDDASGQTLYDGLTQANANSIVAGNNGNSSGNSNSGSNWLEEAGNILTSIFDKFKPSTTTKPPVNTNITNTTPPATTPATSGMGITSILIGVGVIGGIGLLIWSGMNGKKPATRKPAAKKAPAKKAPAKKTK